MKDTLELRGYEVLHKKDGARIMEQVSSFAPDICLLDVMLPFIDGFELISIIRATAGWQSVPIIMLTAKTQEKDAVRALDAGANDYIHKPFAPNELLARVRRYIKSPP